MSNRDCEALTTQPSQKDGWVNWGHYEGKDFVILLPLEDALPYHSSMFYLDAAGVCDIGGQPLAGQIRPQPTPEATPKLTTQPVAVVQSKPQAESKDFPIPPHQVGALIGFSVFVLIAGATWSRFNRNRTDKTPAPKYPDNPFGDEQ